MKNVGDYSTDPEVYEWILEQSPLRDSGRNYLNGREIGDETLAKFRVGQIGNSRHLLDSTLAAFGYDRLRRAGLASAHSESIRFVFPSNYLLFPFLADGKCEYLQARAVDGASRPRWKCPIGLLPPVYNVGALSKSQNIFLCEGVTDVLSAHELGHVAVALLGGSAAVPLDFIARLKGKTIRIIPDNDQAGGRMGASLGHLLTKHGVDNIIQAWPDGINDVNEYLVSVRK
jgi:DNA primase